MQFKTTMRYPLIPVRMATIKNQTNNKCWLWHGEKETLLHCWRKCKSVQPLWKTIWRFFKILKIELPYDIARRSNQSILREINPEYSLEGMMLKLKHHYFCHLMHTKNLLAKSWCWERSGQKENRVSEDERAGQHYGCNEHELRLTLRWQGTGSLVCCSPWGHKESDVTEWLNWTDI